MKIVLALDPSSVSPPVLEETLARPWPANSRFEVVSVVEPSHLWTTSEVAVEAERRAQDVVQRAIERLRAAKQDADGAVFSGDPKTVILDRARDSGGVRADFLIVGSHGVSAVMRMLPGNVAATLLQYAPCSVEVVRARIGKADSGNLRVLLATDGSECSERAAKSIAERPWPTGTQVLILSVVELILSSARAMFELPLIDAEYLESARGEAMQRAQDAIARARQILSATTLDVSESISVLADTPKAVILNEAHEWGADLIVLGSHGRHGMDRFLVGSVSEAVATHAHCSVEVIRPSR